MAWPLTPLETFVARSVPVIKATFLNTLQKWVNDLGLGVVTLKSLVVDGMGGNAVVSVAGSMQVSRSVADDQEPTAAATLKGQVNKESIPTGLASIAGGFHAVNRGYGIQEVTRNGDGDYDVTFKDIPTGNDPTNAVVLVTQTLDVAHDRLVVTKSVNGDNRLVANVLFSNAGADVDFDIVAWVL